MEKINILTRTSNRPYGFKICRESVKNQSYKNIRHIVSSDNDADMNYLKQFNDISVIKIDKEKCNTSYMPKHIPGLPHFKLLPHNLYCNQLLDAVDDGWIMFLDDDDMLIDNRVVETIVDSIRDRDTMLAWRMRFMSGEVIPSDKQFAARKPVLGGIGSPCVLFHSKWKDHFRWDAYKCADFRFIYKLHGAIPKSVWLNQVLIQLNNNAGFGNRKDV